MPSYQQTGIGVWSTLLHCAYSYHTLTSSESLQAEVEEEALFQPALWHVVEAIQVCKGQTAFLSCATVMLLPPRHYHKSQVSTSVRPEHKGP